MNPYLWHRLTDLISNRSAEFLKLKQSCLFFWGCYVLVSKLTSFDKCLTVFHASVFADTFRDVCVVYFHICLTFFDIMLKQNFRKTSAYPWHSKQSSFSKYLLKKTVLENWQTTGSRFGQKFKRRNNSSTLCNIFAANSVISRELFMHRVQNDVKSSRSQNASRRWLSVVDIFYW